MLHSWHYIMFLQAVAAVEECMLVYFLPSWANPKLTASKAVWANTRSWDHHNTLQWVLFPVIPRKQISEGLPLQPHNHSQFLSLERLNNWSTGLPSGFWLSFISSNLGTWRPLKWSSAFLCCVLWDQEQFLHVFTGTCPSSSALWHDCLHSYLGLGNLLCLQSSIAHSPWWCRSAKAVLHADQRYCLHKINRGVMNSWRRGNLDCISLVQSQKVLRGYFFTISDCNSAL